MPELFCSPATTETTKFYLNLNRLEVKENNMDDCKNCVGKKKCKPLVQG
jgi:hypothetical protein